jgi:hypothetical protein
VKISREAECDGSASTDIEERVHGRFVWLHNLARQNEAVCDRGQRMREYWAKRR